MLSRKMNVSHGHYQNAAAALGPNTRASGAPNYKCSVHSHFAKSLNTTPAAPLRSRPGMPRNPKLATPNTSVCLSASFTQKEHARDIACIFCVYVVTQQSPSVACGRMAMPDLATRFNPASPLVD